MLNRGGEVGSMVLNRGGEVGPDVVCEKVKILKVV